MDYQHGRRPRPTGADNPAKHTLRGRLRFNHDQRQHLRRPYRGFHTANFFTPLYTESKKTGNTNVDTS
jgi:hypothetical protein